MNQFGSDLNRFTSDMNQFSSDLNQITSDMNQFSSDLNQFTSDMNQVIYGIKVRLPWSLSEFLCLRHNVVPERNGYAKEETEVTAATRSRVAGRRAAV
uniref:hypothetical protein n=1 Tax=Zoogloea sp. TaxID=49181 RepID=UPI0035AED5DA